MIAFRNVERHDLHRLDASAPFGGQSCRVRPKIGVHLYAAGYLQDLLACPRFEECVLCDDCQYSGFVAGLTKYV